MTRRPFKPQCLPGGMLRRCPQQVQPRRYDPTSAAVVLFISLVFGGVGVLYFVLGVLEGMR